MQRPLLVVRGVREVQDGFLRQRLLGDRPARPLAPTSLTTRRKASIRSASNLGQGNTGPEEQQDPSLSSDVMSRGASIHAPLKPSNANQHNTGSANASVEDLRYEASVCLPPTRSKQWPAGRPRLVDNPALKDDLDLWSQLLKTRLEHSGEQDAIRYIWKGMTLRKVYLPMEITPRSSYIWTMLPLAIEVRDIIEYLQKEHQSHKEKGERIAMKKRFGRELVPHLLRSCLRRGQPGEIERMIQNLDRGHLKTNGALNIMAPDAALSPEGLKSFEALYRTIDARDLYDAFIPALCKAGYHTLAYDWHIRLVGKGDLPKTAAAVAPLLDHFGGGKNPIVHQRILDVANETGVLETSHGGGDPGDDTGAAGREDRKVPIQIRQGDFSDRWVARAYATREISVANITRGLRAFGFARMGPLAMRELALRCSTPALFRQELQYLEQKGISFSDCVYCSLLHHLAETDNGPEYSAIVKSDMHPDVYSDVEVQEKLFAQYARLNDQLLLKRATMILSRFHGRDENVMWNRVLVDHILNRDRVAVKTTAFEMTRLNMPISPQTIAVSFHHFIQVRRRRATKARVHGKRSFASRNVMLGVQDDITFVANLWLDLMRCGQWIRPQAWRWVFINLGRELRLGEMESLALWLAALYTEQSFQSRYLHYDSGTQGMQTRNFPRTPNALSELFNNQFCRAIIVWGTRSIGMAVYYRHQRSPMGAANLSSNWRRGVRLMRTLRDQYGVPIRTSMVRKVFQDRFRQLFDDRFSSKAENRRARRVNRRHLETMVMQLERSWGKRVFHVPAEVMQHETALRLWTMFGRYGKAMEMAGIGLQEDDPESDGGEELYRATLSPRQVVEETAVAW